MICRNIYRGLVSSSLLASALVFPIFVGAAAEADSEVTIHHIHLAASHTAEAVKWYVQHLDCDADSGREDAVHCGGMLLDFVARPSIGGSQGTGINHIAFGYTDVSAKMQALENVGVRGSGVRLQRFADGSTLQEDPDMGLHGFVFDPWGTRIKLVQADQTGFHHVFLESADPAAASAWYVQNVGAQQLPDGGLSIGGVGVRIGQYAEGRPAATDERAIDHLALAVNNIADQVTALQNKNVNLAPLTVPEHARSDAQRTFLSAPDGVLLSLV